MTLLDEVATFIAAGTTLTVGTDLFKGLMPDEPDTCVTIYESPGRAPVEEMGANSPVERPNLQVISRSGAYATARANSQSVWDLLRTVTEQTLSGKHYLRIQPFQSPFLMGRDENRRVRIVFNCTVDKEV